MRSSKFILVLLVFCFVEFAATAKNDQKNNGWKPLFGENLQLAKFNPECWTFEKGVLTASKDEVIWAVGDYENFILDLEFKTESGTNSGVIVYCTNPENWIPNSVEIQIADDYSEKWGNARKDFQCGAIFGHLPANLQKIVNKPGEWNRFSITCKGQLIEVVLNGKLVTSMDMKKWTSGKTNPDGSSIPEWLPKPYAELPTKGAIGLQGKHADASVWFRNVRIKKL